MKERLEQIQKQIEEVAAAAGRDPASVRLVTVSKTIPAERVREAAGLGVNIVGENYIQEVREKFQQLSDLDLSWHFIGHLQSNKAKYAVRMFSLIHSVDSLKLAQELDKQAGKNGKIQDILIQLNISGEETKSGSDPENLKNLIMGMGELQHIRVKGLMTMPPFFDDPDRARPFFAELRKLRDHIKDEVLPHENLPNIQMDELSMGMTGDFTAAIAEGATLVRIGTAIFGRRG